jgi:hypothetical protein
LPVLSFLEVSAGSEPTFPAGNTYFFRLSGVSVKENR